MFKNATGTFLLTAVNAKYIHSNPAVYSLKAYADKYYPDRPAGCALEIAEYTINQTTGAILADLYRKKPQVIAFSCYIWNWTLIQDLLAELPKLLPDTDLWLGGPEVSFDAEKIIQALPQLTGIMVGEGEETLLELLHDYWEQRGSLQEIPGIVWRGGFTGARQAADIDRIPFWAAVDTPHTDALAAFKNRILYYESQRGCPFQCAYCLSSIDKKVRLRAIDTVKAELQYFLDNRVPQVKFIDRTFNCSADHALSVWKYLAENDNGVTNFHFEIAADLLTDAQLDVMRGMRPGLIQLEIGVQSANETTLKAINRHMDIDALRKTVSTVRGFQNIHQHLDLIAGLPHEDYDSFAESFDTVYAMAPDQLQLGFLKILKGSPMEQQAQKYGIVYSAKPPYEVLYTKWLRYEDVLQLKEIEEMVELYYNSGQFRHTLLVLAQLFPSPFRMYEALARHYRANGLFTNVPARTYRYQVLFDFACAAAPQERTLFAELLTFDLYLRENLKSRPDFAPEHTAAESNTSEPNVSEVNALKKKIRQFYAREAQEHCYLKGYDGCTSAQLTRMTHLERFFYPVWESRAADCMKKRDTPAYILFDYQNRGALTHDAAFYEISL